MNSTIASLRHTLVTELDKLGLWKEYILLDYPDHGNAGDHFIALGEIEYLKTHNATCIYLASHRNYDQRVIDSSSRTVPLLFTGGGNVGDMWPHHQKFREKVIAANPDRKIIIFPQAVYFKDTQALREAQDVFNNHKDLTLFVRDTVSLDLAKEYFPTIKIFLAPDAACALIMDPVQIRKEKTLFLSRQDRELFEDDSMKVQQMFDMVEDWRSKHRLKIVTAFQYYVARDKPMFSQKILEESVDQLKDYSLVVTNRLHAHLLAAMMGIPTILLANAYHKNEAFFNTWMKDVTHCFFAHTMKDVEVLLKSNFQKK